MSRNPQSIAAAVARNAAKTKRPTAIAKLPSALPPSTYDEAQGICTVVLPLPPKELHPNARCHWKAKLKPKAAAREAAAYETMLVTKNSRPGWVKATLIINCFLTTRRNADADNIVAWCKPVSDGVCIGGLIVNDSGIAAPTVVFGASRTQPRLELIFRRIE